MPPVRGDGGGRVNRASHTPYGNNSRKGKNRITNNRAGQSNRNSGKLPNMRNQNSSGYISCSYCNKPGHTANQCWNNPNGSRRPPDNPPGRQTCNNCGKPGHAASECWNKSNNGGGSGQPPNNSKRCGTCGKMGHATSVCWHNQNGAPNSSSGSSSRGPPTGPSGAKHCSFCKKSGHTDDVCYKKPASNRQHQNSGNQGSSSQTQHHWARPLKCLISPTDGGVRYPYNPRLKVERRDERVPGQPSSEDERGTNFWAVDSDGDVLMCRVCSAHDVRDEWCLQHCMALIGRQQNANLFQLQKVDEVGLERAMGENYCPGKTSVSG